MEFWRDYLFIATISYIVPLSLIALIPGVYISLVEGYYAIAIFDIFAVIALLAIAFSQGLSIQVKKILFTFTVYALAFVLLTALGTFGPGLVYLLAVSIFMIIIFPYRYAYLSIVLNIFFCILYGIIIHWELLAVYQLDENGVLSWIAVSSNLIFLNAVFAILIPKLFGGMQETINLQLQLQQKLKEEQKNLELSLKELKSKNQELEQFAYVASHDLQEPLRMISNFISLLHKRYYDILDDKGKRYISFTLDGAQRMRQIILDLLELSRVGRTTYKKEKFELQDVIRELNLLLRSGIHKEKARIHCNSNLMIEGYKPAYVQIFQNLVGNSIKYRHPDRSPEISIGAKEAYSSWEFYVKDNGIGIPKEFHDRIFNIFQRLHNQKEVKGSGIGLSIVKKLVENLGGEIRVESEINYGSTFLFRLPKKVEAIG